MAKKSLGQNFLIDPNYQRKIIHSVSANYDGQTILEIGPGKGALTQHLAEFAKSLILVEKDNQLVDELKQRFKQKNHIQVIHHDFLDLDLLSLRVPQSGTWQSKKSERLLDRHVALWAPRDDKSDKKISVVANLPYNVASQILIKLFIHNEFFDRLYLMFQREVAHRCVARPRTKEYGIFTIWAQIFSQKIEKLFDIPPTAFRPQPKVTSTFLKFTLKSVDYERERPFIDFVKRVFNHRRKKISTILKKDFFSENFLSQINKRAEELTLGELKELFLNYSQNLV